jgi:hyaluronoglucosaminidase
MRGTVRPAALALVWATVVAVGPACDSGRSDEAAPTTRRAPTTTSSTLLRRDASSSPFPMRGVIQGFYGQPWSHTERMATLRWMGAQGMNVYVHAPKADPWQLASWRDPYPPEQLEELRDEVREATAAGVTWVPNLSPSLPIDPAQPAPGAVRSVDVCFSCPADLAVIQRKLDPYFDAGARILMLSFDDVQKISSHPEDARAYGSGPQAYGRMNRDLLNAVFRHYRDRAAAAGQQFTLLTVLADYAGTADTPYLTAVRSDGGLDAGIEVMWTGTGVVSKTISPADAAVYAGRVGRERVVVWDNYPVNDFTAIAGGRARLFLGPYSGRGADLASSVSGILANPMNEALASRVALGTIAAYLADPAGYEPEAAWREALRDLANGDEALTDALAALAENSRSSGLDRSESVLFASLRDAFLGAYRAGPFWAGEREALLREAAREGAAATVIRERHPELGREIGPWLDRLTENARAVEAATAALAAMRPSLSASARRLPNGVVRVFGEAAAPTAPAAAAALEAAGGGRRSVEEPLVTHGDRYIYPIGNGRADENLVDAYVAVVSDLYRRWSRSAGRASGRMTVTAASQAVPLADDGSFAVEVDVPGDALEVVATDGAGGQFGLRLDV